MQSEEYWGIAIPGLAMASWELPEVDGLLRLDNPEIGNGPIWLPNDYTLLDVARFHAERCKNFNWTHSPVVQGMSMGGMIALLMASEFRHFFPQRTEFRILVSSMNLPSMPAVPDSLLRSWYSAKPGDPHSFEPILRPFFAPSFLTSSPHALEEYCVHRAEGRNGQSTQGFLRQLSAVRGFGLWYWIGSGNLQTTCRSACRKN